MAKYTSRPEVIRKRVEQNKARRAMMKAGKVHKGDGKDVDHRTPLSKGGTSARSNLRVVSRHTNRSFHRNADGSIHGRDGRGSVLNEITKRKKK